MVVLRIVNLQSTVNPEENTVPEIAAEIETASPQKVTDSVIIQETETDEDTEGQGPLLQTEAGVKNLGLKINRPVNQIVHQQM